MSSALEIPVDECVDAVVPLTLADWSRFQILFSSLKSRFHCGRCLFVVVPEGQIQAFRARLQSFCGDALLAPNAAEPSCPRRETELPGWVRLLSEEAVVPQLSRSPKLRGWFKQQLVKMAIAAQVKTAFYITLDADVVCTRDVEFDLLVRDGCGVCKTHQEDLHADWYAQSVEVLGLQPARTGISHNVTPAVLSRDGMLALCEHLTHVAQTQPMGVGGKLKQLFRRPPTSSWQSYLAANTPWTEYALYYTYLEATQTFSHYHFEAPVGLYDKSDSVWRKDAAMFGQWDPKPLFTGTTLPVFVVIQSISGLEPERIQKKLAPYL